jgi:hypothetical protein
VLLAPPSKVSTATLVVVVTASTSSPRYLEVTAQAWGSGRTTGSRLGVGETLGAGRVVRVGVGVGVRDGVGLTVGVVLLVLVRGDAVPGPLGPGVVIDDGEAAGAAVDWGTEGDPHAASPATRAAATDQVSAWPDITASSASVARW